MNKRIRYTKREDGTSVSVQILKSDSGEEYQVRLLPDGKNAYILDGSGSAMIEQVEGTSPHKTKIAVKTALTKRGVKFEKEERG